MARSTRTAAQKVFICYRREGTAAYAGRLYDAMVARFGESNVFMDVEIEPGLDFAARIEEVISGCVALIVVIGPNWAQVVGEDGEPRIHDPEDFVRREVAAGLAQTDATVIPALVGKAQMPRPEGLPEELRPLTRRNALELSDARWAYDVGRLNLALDRLLTDGHGRREEGEDGGEERWEASVSPARLLLEGVLLAGATAFVGRGLSDLIDVSAGTAGDIATVVLRRGLTWAVVGAALCLWLGFRAARTDLGRRGVVGFLVGALAGTIGGAVWALPVYLNDPNLSLAASNEVQVGALAVSTGLIGALIGSQWQPRRPWVGLLSGALAGVLLQLVLNAAGWENTSTTVTALSLAFDAIAVTGGTVATMLALDRGRSRSYTGASAAVGLAKGD